MVQDKPVAYFNNAGKTWSPPSVLDAGVQSLQYENQPWKVPPTSLEQITLQVRQLFASLIHAPNKDCIAICPSTAFSMTLIAHNIAKSYSSSNTMMKKILVLQDEMSSEIYPWQEVFPCSLEIIPYPCPSSSSWEKDIIHTIKRFKNQIAAVCIPQIHWSDGSIIGIETISQVCHEYTIPLIIDGTQSVGILPIDVQEIPCDAFVASTHKWLLGPRGISLMYIHPKYHTIWLPLDQHERSRIAFTKDDCIDATENSILSNCGYPEEFISGAIRFDSGGRKNLVLLSMVQEGLRIVTNLNLNQAQKQLFQITTYIIQHVQHLGFYCRYTHRAGHTLGLRPTCTSTWTTEKLLELCQRFQERNIFVAIRHGAIRISPYLNTSQDEVDSLIQGFKDVVHEMIPNHVT